MDAVLHFSLAMVLYLLRWLQSAEGHTFVDEVSAEFAAEIEAAEGAAAAAAAPPTDATASASTSTSANTSTNAPGGAVLGLRT